MNNLHPHYFLSFKSYLIGGFTPPSPPPPVQCQSVLVSGSQPSLDRPIMSFVAATYQLGVAAPLERIILPNPIDPVFRLSTTPVSGETPVHRLAAIDRNCRPWSRASLPLARQSTLFGMGGFRPPTIPCGFAFVPL